MSLDTISDERAELNTELKNWCDKINTGRFTIRSGRLQHNKILWTSSEETFLQTLSTNFSDWKFDWMNLGKTASISKINWNILGETKHKPPRLTNWLNREFSQIFSSFDKLILIMFWLKEIFSEMIWLVKSNSQVGHKIIGLACRIYNGFDKLYKNLAIAFAI